LLARASSIALLYAHPPPHPTDGHWTYVAALWFLVITAYVLSTHILTNLVQFGLGTFLPRILGYASLSVAPLPWPLKVLDWTVPIAYFLVGFAIISLVVSSATQALATIKRDQASFYTEVMEHAAHLAVDPAPPTPLYLRKITSELLGRASEVLFVTLRQFTRYATELLVRNIAKIFRESLVYLWRMVRYLIVPVFSFSLLSVIIIIVLRNYHAYIVNPVAHRPHHGRTA
jgi:hypothetical protein